MGQVVITGANGFIGREVCARFRAAGYEVVALCRAPRDGTALRWSLGELLPKECRSAELVVHLASATLNERGADRAAAMRSDLDGTQAIVEQLRGWRLDGSRHRFVFMSSQSARPDATNDYGRNKWEIEQTLDRDEEVIIRPGLVYSDPPRSVYAMFDRLSRLPVVPVIATRSCIQPVSVQELAESVLRVSTAERVPKLAMIGAVEPMTFSEAVKATALRSGRRAPITLPISVGPLKVAAAVFDRLLGSTISERLNGIIGLHPIDTAASAAALNQRIRAF